MRIYRYVLTSDTGMAPSIDQGVVSLATCKPVIRRCAGPGDWVVENTGSTAWARATRPVCWRGFGASARPASMVSRRIKKASVDVRRDADRGRPQ